MIWSRILDALNLGFARRALSGILLSKTRYLVGLQCPKALWINYNDRALIPEFSAATLAIFEQGHEVGLLAQKIFPNGIDIGYIRDPNEAIGATRTQFGFRRPIFEAAVAFKNCFSRADILVPAEEDCWDIVEVKSSTELKPIYLQDLAFQRHVYEGAGLVIRNCYLLHVNNGYVRNGPIVANDFFSKIDVTREVGELLSSVEANVRKMLKIVAARKCPDIRISPHCNDPYECQLKPVCWNFLPQPNVLRLRNGRKKRWELLNRGITRLRDIPSDFVLSDAQARQVASHRNGAPHVDSAAIAAFLRQLVYPLFFLDFETVQPAIPLYDRSRPYAKVPFQFSLDRIYFDGAAPEHFSFLVDGQLDPRPVLLSRLKELLASSGSIIGYNVAFEIGCLRECASIFPEYRTWLDSIEFRFVDLYEIFDRFDYYHPSQNGTASLKTVLPILTECRYDDLDIQDGELAQREFLRVTFGDVSEDERLKVRRALEAYCAMDTRGLIAIVDALKKITSFRSHATQIP
jgi:hypothetical protein